MILTKVTIDSFRTLISPRSIVIDPKMTVLIGANESGKTNLLQAIQRLSLNNDYQNEDISRCRRRKYAKNMLPIVSFEFFISQEEKEKFKKQSSSIAGHESIIIRKKGNGIKGYSVTAPKESLLKSLKEEKKEILSYLKRLNRKEKINDKRISQILIKSKIEADPIKNLELQGQLEFIKKASKENESEKKLLEKKLTEINSSIKKPSRNPISIPEGEISALLNMLPEVVYVEKLDFLPDSIPITEIIAQKTPKSIAMGNLLKIGGIEELTILNETARRLKAQLMLTARVISDKLVEFWKQESLEIELTKEGANLVISINEKIAISSSPEERSEGFQWFLSFLANFPPKSAQQKNSKLILLDEPAIRLHPKGQKDFLTIVETISEGNQVIYTSHSPFLINRNYPQRIRLLTKDPKKGTMINNKPYSDGKTRFWEPLKSAIGICLGDLFSLGETNLIVEGISDQIILTGISSKLAEISTNFLDLEKTSIVPAMGSSTVAYLSKFASSEGLKTFALFDNDAEGKKALLQLKKETKIISKSVNELKSGAVTIEDLIPRDKYVKAVNSFYSKIGLSDYKEFQNTQETEEKNSKQNGILQELYPHFKEMGYSFDKVSVAKELIQLLDISVKKLSEYKPFIKLFEVINKIN